LTFEKRFEDPGEAFRREQTLLDVFDDEKGLETSTAPFSNKTNLSLRRVYEEDHTLLEQNFRAYINGFSKNVDDIIGHFNYRATIGQMVKNNRLAPILNQYKELDLGPEKLSPLEMGYIHEELLRRFSEQSGEEAGEYFTPPRSDPANGGATRHPAARSAHLNLRSGLRDRRHVVSGQGTPPRSCRHARATIEY
jgi:type I restriction-modification system DNA methylase subunit